MFASKCSGRPAGIVAGYLADLALADPGRGHPVALFGRGAAALERFTYSDDRWTGAIHTGVLLGALMVLGAAGERAALRRGHAWTTAITAATTFVALGGTSLTRTGARMAVLSSDDAGAGRRLPPRLADYPAAWMPTDWRAAAGRCRETTRTWRRCCGPWSAACPQCWSIAAPTHSTR